MTFYIRNVARLKISTVGACPARSMSSTQRRNPRLLKQARKSQVCHIVTQSLFLNKSYDSMSFFSWPGEWRNLYMRSDVSHRKGTRWLLLLVLLQLRSMSGLWRSQREEIKKKKKIKRRFSDMQLERANNAKICVASFEQFKFKWCNTYSRELWSYYHTPDIATSNLS